MSGENWAIVAGFAIWGTVRLAQILAGYLAGKRRDQLKAEGAARG